MTSDTEWDNACERLINKSSLASLRKGSRMVVSAAFSSGRRLLDATKRYEIISGRETAAEMACLYNVSAPTVTQSFRFIGPDRLILASHQPNDRTRRVCVARPSSR
jgi:hypothetical protein